MEEGGVKNACVRVAVGESPPPIDFASNWLAQHKSSRTCGPSERESEVKMSENPGWVETKEEVEEGGGYLVNCVEAEQIRADHRILSAFKHSADNQK